MPRHAAIPTCLLLCSLAGCAAPDRASPRAATPLTRSAPDAGSGARSPLGRVPLLINGDPVGWDELTPLLAEAAGDAVTDELALERALRRVLRSRNLSIGASEVEAERERWLTLLEQEGVEPGAASEVRRRRGLGPERFSRLLWRNAALRALLDPDETAVSETEVDLAVEIRSGARYAASGVVLPDAPSAVRLAEEMKTDEQGPAAAMWTGAVQSGARPWHAVISPVDPAWPEAVRRLLPRLAPGKPSGVVALDEGYGVVLVHARVPASEGAVDRQALREEIRVRKARVAMERLAQRLLSETEVNALSPSLSWPR